MGSQKSSIFQ